MPTAAIPDVEILTVRLITVCFNVFARLNQLLWFKSWGVWGNGIGGAVESCQLMFREGTS